MRILPRAACIAATTTFLSACHALPKTIRASCLFAYATSALYSGLGLRRPDNAAAVSERHLSGEAAARVMVLNAVAHADAFIASWGYKNQFNTIRTRGYIRSRVDSTWESLIPTPPFPGYPNGYSTVSASAATLLAALLGDGPLVDSTGISLGHAARHFPSFTAASGEAGQSRVYGGIHVPPRNLGGRTLGQCVGAKVVQGFKAERIQ